jgi:hypothetical protein
MMQLPQRWTFSLRMDIKKSCQEQSQSMLKLIEFFLPLTMNYSTQTSLKHQLILSVYKNQTKLNIYSDLSPNNLWLTHLCSSVEAQKAWMYLFMRIAQVPPKWISLDKIEPSHHMESPKTVDSSLNIDVEQHQDGEWLKWIKIHIILNYKLH